MSVQEQITQLTQLVAQLANLQASNTTNNPPQTLNPRFSFGEFKTTNTESFEEYIERFKLQLSLCNVPNNQHAVHLRVHMGADANTTLRNLIYPNDANELDFKTIVETLKAHYDKSRNKFSEAIRFRNIIQMQDETVTKYIERLKAGARYCEFENFLDYSLTVQFIHGVYRDDIRDEVVAKKPNKFDKVMQIALDMEATRDASNILKPNSNSAINKFMHDSRPRIKKQANNRSFSSSRRSHSQSSSRHSNQKSEARTASPKYNCFGCGGKHWRQNCKFKDAKCRICNTKGHIAAVCRKRSDSKTHQTSDADLNTSDADLNQDDQLTMSQSHVAYLQDEAAVNKIGDRTPPVMIKVLLNSHPVTMELDTAGACSMINRDTLKNILPNIQLSPSSRTFCSFTKNKFQCQYTPIQVTFRGRTKTLDLYVTDFPSDTIFGREWIIHFSDLLSFRDMFEVHQLTISTADKTSLDKLLFKYEDLFSDSAGTLTGPPVDIHFKTDAQPVFARARPLPHSLLATYANEIDKKIQSGCYKRVTHSQWASPTHVVVKNGKIRITGDYKSTLNPQLIVDEYPIPRTDEIFNKLKGAKIFCRLDVADAFMCLTCSEEFCQAMTLNTPTHGLIQPTRAQYGVASIPAIWQRRMEEILRGLPNATNFFDDILVFSSTIENLLLALEATFEKLHSAGLKLRRSKCAFLLESVEFLGHRVDSSGLHKLDKHVTAILNAPRPENPATLQTFLGKITYYRSFIPNLSTRSSPLQDMLKKTPFRWTEEGKEAFKDLQAELISDRVLVPYHPELPLILAVDASPVGLGAVISHLMTDGSERPIAYASKSLNTTERSYPQIDKEALAIVWAVKKFFQYVYGRRFTIFTDNKPVSHIFSPNALLPKFTLSRCSNYASYLTNFNYDIKFKTSRQNANADYLSRAISPVQQKKVNIVHHSENIAEPDERDEFDSFILQQIRQLPITADDIASETRRDSVLSPLLLAIQEGRNLASLGCTGNQLNYTQSCGCLMLGHRVVIPEKFRPNLLQELHTAHIGITKMKGIARSLIYWPSIDKDIEQLAKSCSECLKHSKMPAKYNSHHWEYPNDPWERVHIDYAGPVNGKYLLIIVDAYSKWTQVKITSSITSEATCKILEEIFSIFGVPTTVVSDNGTQFTSEEFKNFLKNQGVRFHKRTAPYHPATNGQAERYVQTVKKALLTAGATASNLQQCINKFLLQYHKAPHQSTGQSPSLLFLGRTIKSRLDCLRPDLKLKVLTKQEPELLNQPRTFSPNEKVMFRCYSSPATPWLPGTVVTKLGNLHYEVEYKGNRHKRHIDQLKSYLSPPEPQPISPRNPERRIRFYENQQPHHPETPARGTPPAPIADQPRQTPELPLPRRTQRIRRPRILYSP